MSRREFPKAVKVAVIKRALKDGVIRCEECHGEASKHEIDHVNADALTGTPTIDNARLLCKPCHAAKTKSDVAVIAKAKRREAAHLGVHKQATLKGAGFTPAPKQLKASKPIDKLAALPRRVMFQ